MKRLTLLAGAILLATGGCTTYSDWSAAPGYGYGYGGARIGSVSDFYGLLGPYGSWFMHPMYGRVFQPYGIDTSWMPYSQGYWRDDPSYGRLWESSEPFGWATYHYGRWDRDASRGWFWVPDTHYGPGWVDWRRSGSEIGWAPLRPEVRHRTGSGRAATSVPRSWAYAPESRMHSRDLSRYLSVSREKRGTTMRPPEIRRAATPNRRTTSSAGTRQNTRPVVRPDTRTQTRPNPRANPHADRPHTAPPRARPATGPADRNGAAAMPHRQPRSERPAATRTKRDARPASERRQRTDRNRTGARSTTGQRTHGPRTMMQPRTTGPRASTSRAMAPRAGGSRSMQRGSGPSSSRHAPGRRR